MIKREELIKEELVRNYIKQNIKSYIENTLQEEVKVRKYIQKILLEKSDFVPTKLTGMNKLAKLLSEILPNIEEGFRELTTAKSQRDSYRKHLVTGIQKELSSIDQMQDTAEKAAEQVSEQITLHVSGEENQEDFNEAKDELGLSDLDFSDEDTSAFKDDSEVSEEDDEIKSFEIQGLDKTGMQAAFSVYKNIIKKVIDSFSQLYNDIDKRVFKKYLIKNLDEHFNRWEATITQGDNK